MEKILKEKGITLIALVITIIVLLILAGVSIATLTGPNGLITKANEAKEVTEKAEAKEKVQMEIIGSFDKYGKFNMDNLKDNLKNNLGIQDGDLTDNGDGSITVTIDGDEVTICENGEIKEPINYPTFATETTSADYGKYVKYNMDYDKDGDIKDDWRIFYNDGTNIYLISSDYVMPQEYEFASGGYRSLNLYNIGYTTVDAVIEFLLDTKKWEILNDGKLADYVTGATTLEMYVKSYNQTNPEEKIYLANGTNGYLIGNTENPTNTSLSFTKEPSDLYYVDKGTMPDKYTSNMWIASKMDNGNLMRGGYNLNSYESNTTGHITGNSGYLYVGIRPIVCLKEEVILSQGTGSVENPFEISLK